MSLACAVERSLHVALAPPKPGAHPYARLRTGGNARADTLTTRLIEKPKAKSQKPKAKSQKLKAKPNVCQFPHHARTLAGMKSMDRRRFLLATAATAALPTLKSFAQAATATTPNATLKLHSDETGPRIPDNFIGLCYESNELADPLFFSSKTRTHRAIQRALARGRPPHRRQHHRIRLLAAHARQRRTPPSTSAEPA